MIEWLKANWRAFMRAAIVLGAYFFVMRYPLTDGQRQDLMLLVVGSGVWAALAPGIRAPRREDDPE